MFQIQRRNTEAKMQSRCSDDQILEGNNVTSRCLVTLYLTCEAGNLERDWIYDQVLKGALSKYAPPYAVGISVGSVNTVSQLHDADSRKRNVNLSVRVTYRAKNIFNSLAAPFTRNQNAGIKYQVQDLTPLGPITWLSFADDFLKI